MAEQILSRTGPQRFIVIEGRNVGAAMVETIANVVVNHDGEAASRNAIRKTSRTGSRGGVYQAIQSCIDAGLFVYLTPANGPQGSYPRVQVTPLGLEAMRRWNEPAEVTT